MQTREKGQLDALGSGPVFRFDAWPNEAVPAVAAGTYSIWHGAQLIYVGMAGRSLTTESILKHREDLTKVTGLRSRLDSHASGRRSGDQFCLYVGDLLVLPSLSTAAIADIAARRVKMDHLVRGYIREHLAYRFVETPDASTARALEAQIRRGALDAGAPLLNPL